MHSLAIHKRSKENWKSVNINWKSLKTRCESSKYYSKMRKVNSPIVHRRDAPPTKTAATNINENRGLLRTIATRCRSLAYLVLFLLLHGCSLWCHVHSHSMLYGFVDFNAQSYFHRVVIAPLFADIPTVVMMMAMIRLMIQGVWAGQHQKIISRQNSRLVRTMAMEGFLI